MYTLHYTMNRTMYTVNCILYRAHGSHYAVHSPIQGSKRMASVILSFPSQSYVPPLIKKNTTPDHILTSFTIL